MDTTLLGGIDGGVTCPTDCVRFLVGGTPSIDPGGEGAGGGGVGSDSDWARILEGIAGTMPFNGALREGGGGTTREGDDTTEAGRPGGGGGALPVTESGGGGTARAVPLREGIAGATREGECVKGELDRGVGCGGVDVLGGGLGLFGGGGARAGA